MIKKFGDKLIGNFSESTKGRFLSAVMDIFLLYKNFSRYK